MEEIYTQYGKMLKRVLKKAKRQYWDAKLNSCKSQLKDTWKIINQLLGRNNKKKDFPNTFYSDGNTIQGSVNIANQFNDFFSNIGKKTC